MVKGVLKWVDKKTEEIDVINDKHPYLKAFGLGCIEGVIDGAVIAYPILMATCIGVLAGIKKGDIVIKDKAQ